MSSDNTNSNSNAALKSRASLSADTAVKNKPSAMSSDAGLKQDKYKQDQLKMEKFRQEMLRQEKLRQELEDQELQRQKGFEQETLKEQQQLKQAQLEQAKNEKLKAEKVLLEKVRIESERAAKLKLAKEQIANDKAIAKEKLNQEKLMQERLRKKNLERDQQPGQEQQPQQVLAAQAFEQQETIIDNTPEPSAKNSMFGLADKLFSSLKSAEETAAPTQASQVTIEQTAEPVVSQQPQKITTAMENSARSLQLCGNIEDQDYRVNLDALRYNSDDYALSSVLHYLDQSKLSTAAIRLTFDEIVLVIDYALNTIYCNTPLSSDAFDKLCTTYPVPSFDVYQLEFEEVRSERRNNSKQGHSTEAFIWTCTLLTAKGRLPLYADASRSIGVKQNADIRKLEAFPFLENIIAELKASPCALMEISARMNIPQKYAIAFYNAAANINLLDFDVQNKAQAKISKPKKASSGFFSFKR